MRRVWHGRTQITDSNGDPVVGAKLEFFAAGTADQLNTYSDYALGSANTNPVVSDAGGWVTIFLSKNVFYDYTTTDSDDVSIYDKELNIFAYEPPLTTKGDIFTFDTDFQRLAVGTDDQVLKADSSTATGLAWGTGTEDTLSTKGDLFTYDTGNARLAVGNDNDILVADSSEATGLKWIEMPTCGVYLASSHGITQNTWTKVVFDTEEFDTGSDFATGTYTVPVSGKYLALWHVSVTSMSDRKTSDTMLYVDGSAFKHGVTLDTSTATTDSLGGGGMALLDLTSSQTIDIYVRVENTSISALGGQELTYFAIHRVSP